MLNELLAYEDDDIENTLSEKVEFLTRDSLPDSENIPLEKQKWIQLSNISVLFIDMVNSTQIDFENRPRKSASIYEVFTGEMVDILYEFEASRIEIQGDGIIGIFDAENSCAQALLTAVTFRTICERLIKPKILGATNNKVEIKCRSSICTGPTIVKRIGRRGYNKEVWAYRTVNRAAKLARIAAPEALVADSDSFRIFSKCEDAVKSCGCGNDGIRSDLWREVDSTRLAGLNIENAFELKSIWCKDHGDEYFDRIAEFYGVKLSRIGELVESLGA